MRAIVTAEARFLRTPDGRVWTPTGAGRSFWERYLAAFDSVRVVARVLDTATVPRGATRVDGGAVEVWPVPYYVGPVRYIRRLPAVRRAVRRAATADDAVIIRAPSPIGSLLAAARDAAGLPYALEVVGDPYDVFAPGVVRHPLRPAIRYRSVANLRRQCVRAVGVAYVTERTLQARYPAGPSAETTTFSSIELGPEAFVPAARPARADPCAIVSVGSLEQPYKGIGTLIEAVAWLVAHGRRPRLVHVGDGRCRGELERLATRLGVADRVTFVGAVPAGDAVRAHIDAADLVVMPSRTEGLPRALIEAMARGLPAIGSTAGGIPELLPAEHLVEPGNPPALALAIGALLADPARMAAASAANLARARGFAADVLGPRREAWYTTVRDATSRRRSGSAQNRETPVRVTHVIGTLDRGGAETVALDLCAALPATRIHQTFVTLGGRPGALAPEFRAAGADVRQCPLTPRYTFPRRLWRCLRSLRPDVVISHVSLTSGLVLLVALAAGVRVRVARLHSEGDGRRLTPRRRAQRAVLRSVLRLCATDVVGVTAAALRFAGPRSGDGRYRVLYNGVNLDRLDGSVDASARVAARRTLGLPLDPPIVVHIGRAAPEKNRQFLIDIHHAVRRRVPAALLVVVGPGGHADITRAFPGVAVDPTVILLGEREDITTILAAADVMVLPSVREGLPGVVLEALSAGLPVVATDLAGLREVRREVEGLHLLPLSAHADRWADLALAACRAGHGRRDEIRRGLRSSPFVLEQAAREWELLCLRPP